jgi:iron-sulfur cluster assembly accessory protein
MRIVTKGGKIEMVTLTQKAESKVQEVMASQTDSESISGIRVSVVGGGCSGFQYEMKLASASEDGDEVIEADGFKVFVDSQSRAYLEGTEIDFVETPQGTGFKFNNPNVTDSCGCGESFRV